MAARKYISKCLEGLSLGSSLAHVLLGLAVALVIGASFLPPIGLYDEGFALTNAWRLLNGEIPHRDYWTAYPPGTSAFLALTYSFLGADLFASRVANVIWSLVMVAAVYSITSRLQPKVIAAIGSLLFAWWFVAAIYPSYSATPAIALSLVTGALLLSAYGARQARTVAAAAFVGGIAILFRHDFALYLLISCTFALFVDAQIGGRLDGDKKTESQPYRLAVVFFLLASIFSLGGLCGLVYWAGYSDVIDQMLVFPATGMREHRLLPVPNFFDFFSEWKPHWILAWGAPFVIFLGLLISLTSSAWNESLRRRAIVFSGLMSVFLIFQARNRFDLAHAAPSILFALVFVLAVCVDLTSVTKRRTSGALSLALMLGVASYSLLYIPTTFNTHRALGCVLPLDEEKCMPENPDQRKVVDYINSRLSRKEQIFVGNTKHDQIFINDASLYFLLQRAIPIKWNEMHPGVITTVDVQKAVVQGLAQRCIPLAVLVEIGPSKEPNKSSVSSSVHILDEYLMSNYSSVAVFGKYSIYQRSAPCS